MNEDKKLNGRDLINIGIYGAIYFVILFAVAMLGMIPIFLPLLSVFVPILGGIPFMLFLTRVKKPGMIFIFAMIMGILMLLTGMGPWPLLTCAVAGLLAELVLKSGDYRDAKKAVLSYGLFSTWIFGNYLPLFTDYEGYFALFCGGILTRFVVTIMMGEYVIVTTSVSEFISAMEKLHMPQQVTIPLSVMFRLFPTIGAEWKSIRRAMRMRGIHLGGAKAGQVVEYQMVPMMTSSVRIGEELSASALTRGLGAPVKRTNICRIGFRAQDYLLLAGCLFVVCAWILELCGVRLW